MKHLTKAVTFAVAALVMSAAQAIDKSTPLLLMDDGFGSDATYGFMDYTEDACMILGKKNDAFGRSIPMMWEVEDGVVTATALPVPAGFSGVAMGWAKFPNHETIVTGNLIDNNSNSHAVVWRSVNYGPWQMPVRLSPLTALDIAGHEMQHGVQAEVAGSVFENGAWRPVVFTIKPNLDITHTLLPATTGGGMASGMDEGPNGGLSVSGWLMAPSGLRKPVIWTDDGSGFVTRPIAVQNGVGGQAYRSSPKDDGVVCVVGDLFRSGRTMGVFSVDPAQQGSSLRPVEGFENSTAYNLGNTGTHEVGHWVFGASSNPGGLPSSTVWLPLALDDYGPFPMQQFLSDPNSVARVTSFKPGQGCVVGSVIPGGSVFSQACVFTSDGSQAPDNVDVPVGRAFGDVAAMVHNDGEIYAVRTERINGQRMACVDLELNPLSFTAGQEDRFGADILFPNAATGGTINVYFFNHSTQEFESFYTNNPGGGLLGISAPLPAAARSSAGQVKIRIEFKHAGNQPRTIGIETIEVAHEG
jgi:hypothetical protein